VPNSAEEKIKLNNVDNKRKRAKNKCQDLQEARKDGRREM
jgi:hypothetical protein